MSTPITKGVHHIGLTVSKLEESAAFFISLPGWREVRRNEEYPAIFVSDGSIMLTLWAAKEQPIVPFNRRRNIGLHHLALQVENEESLNRIYGLLTNNGTKIEFAPELVRQGPAKHLMCYEPSGIRVEFIWPGN
jgi:catechol 2,3-dioxygenase-like lactoylglutathione lyase family enzyme